MPKLKTTHQTTYSLNIQIRQLQQQIADERALQHQRQQQFRQVLSNRLTSWPMLLGAVAAGVVLRQINTASTVQARPPRAASPAIAAASSTNAPAESAVTIATSTARQPFWSTLLSLPLLTQSIWWWLQQLWQSRLFRDLVRHKLIKSEQRHPPY